MKNFEKAKFLKETRQRMNWTQVQFGDALGLDSSYVSQLENAKRPISDWYVEKARELREGFEKSKNVKATKSDAGPETEVSRSLRAQCLQYLNLFLESCAGDESALHWTLIELRTHFPLSKWQRPDVMALNDAASSSGLSPLEDTADAVEAELARPRVKSQRRSGAASPTVRKGKR